VTVEFRTRQQSCQIRPAGQFYPDVNVPQATWHKSIAPYDICSLWPCGRQFFTE
jgi:hypothetical protein